MAKRTFITLSIFAAMLVAVACGVHQTTAPSLSGPSEFALAVGLTATPDAISQDGGSQSSIRVSASGPNGQPVTGQTFRLDLLVNGTEVDYGTLSARTVVTGTDGTAAAIYTAPPALPAGATLGTCATFNTPGALAGQCVTITATPTGSNFQTSQTRTVDIRLTPVGVIGAPVRTPTAVPTFSPTTPAANSPVLFDGSTSCAGPVDSGGNCPSGSGTIVSYQWNFGDGSTGSGPVVNHTYIVAQSYNATLTVTNDTGGTASATKPVPVGASVSTPTAAFVISPTGPFAGQTVSFNADASRAGAGRTLTAYNWNFGDSDLSSNTGSGFFVQHKYVTAGTYTVVLTVADDAGQKATISQTVPIASGAASASFTVTKTGANSVHVDATGSSAVAPGATISTFLFTWIDGASHDQFSGATDDIVFANAPGTFTINLKVTDSLGNVGTTAQTVILP